MFFKPCLKTTAVFHVVLPLCGAVVTLNVAKRLVSVHGFYKVDL